MERKGKKETWKELWGKYRAAALILAAGVLLLAWPAEKDTAAETGGGEHAGEQEMLLRTEARMEEILSRIEGVGDLWVMLMLESGTRQELAVDTELSYRGETAAPEDYSRRSETVIVSGEKGDVPVVTYSRGPVYRGAVVVCQGAERGEVRLAVTEAVAALTGLGADRIKVIKCQS